MKISPHSILPMGTQTVTQTSYFLLLCGPLKKSFKVHFTTSGNAYRIQRFVLKNIRENSFVQLSLLAHLTLSANIILCDVKTMIEGFAYS